MKFFNLLLIIFIISSCTSPKKEENEPNNTFADANDLELGKPVTGYIDTNKDIDTFTLSIQDRGILDISLSAIKGINSSIKIWSDNHGDPQLLKFIDDTRKSSPEHIYNMFVEPGIYYITIQHGLKDKRKANRETPYTLEVNRRSPGTEESEPNDTVETANRIILNEEMTGYYSTGYNRLNDNKNSNYREEDWFSFNVETVEPVLLDIHITPVTGINPIVYIFDQDMKQIIESDKLGKDAGESIENLGIHGPGTYYIMITSSTYTSSPKPYTLQVTRKEIDPNAEVEINNTFDTANTIVDNTIDAKINSVNDIDYFLFKNSDENPYHAVEVTPTTNIDLVLHLFDKNRTKLYTINNNPRGVKEKFPNFYLNDDEFYIAVGSKSTVMTPDDLTYRVSVNPLENYSEDQQGEHEPNNNKKNATIIQKNTITGYISEKNDKDYYKFVFDKRVKVTLEIQGVLDGAVTVSVTDPLGYTIKSVDISGDETVKISEMIDRKGFIIIESKKENYDNPYTITIQ